MGGVRVFRWVSALSGTFNLCSLFCSFFFLLFLFIAVHIQAAASIGLYPIAGVFCSILVGQRIDTHLYPYPYPYAYALGNTHIRPVVHHRQLAIFVVFSFSFLITKATRRMQRYLPPSKSLSLAICAHIFSGGRLGAVFIFIFFGRLVLVFGWFRLLCSGNNSISARVYFQPPRAVHFFYLFFFFPTTPYYCPAVFLPFFPCIIFLYASELLAAPNSFSSFLLVLPFFHPYFASALVCFCMPLLPGKATRGKDVACCAAGLYRSEDTRAWTLVIIHQSEMLI